MFSRSSSLLQRYYLVRRWFLDLDLARSIVDALPPEAKFRPIPPIGPEPDPAFYERLLGVTTPPRPAPVRALTVRGANEGVEAPAQAAAATVDFSRFEALRTPLSKLLGPSVVFNPGKLWPYVPIHPWLDCNPDVIFKVTQPCNGVQTVILDERAASTRQNIGVNTNVTLITGPNACCIEDEIPCSGEDCLILTQVCGVLANQIGGNPASGITALEYEGYANPHTNDSPFAGNITVSGTTDCMDAADYYTFFVQRRLTPLSWGPESAIPEEDLGPIGRWYITIDSSVTPPVIVWHPAVFNPTPFGTRTVYESRLHYEAAHWTDPSLVYQWVSNHDGLLEWRTTATDQPDGVYRLRPQGYSEAGGVLTEVNLNECGTDENVVIVRIDNRFDPDIAHPADHPCGEGTVHTCTTQPDVDIVAAGGVFRLTLIGAAAIEEAFPIPCCYALDLTAFNRTIVSCSSQFTNAAHYTFTVI